MKSYALILLTSFFILSLVSNAQQVNPGKTKKTLVFTKGYYSIENNAEKIHSTSLIVADTLMSPVITKGFYSTGTNNKKLPKRLTWFRVTNPKPVITKGYYSIGDHWKRMYKRN